MIFVTFYPCKSIKFIVCPRPCCPPLPLLPSLCIPFPPPSGFLSHSLCSFLLFCPTQLFTLVCIFQCHAFLLKLGTFALYLKFVNLLGSSHYIFRSPPSGQIYNKYRIGLGWVRCVPFSTTSLVIWNQDVLILL